MLFCRFLAAAALLPPSLPAANKCGPMQSSADSTGVTPQDETDWSHERYSGVLSPSQQSQLESIMHRFKDWLLAELDSSPADGIGGISEFSYCRRRWTPMFNATDGGISRSRFRVVEDGSQTLADFADAMDEFTLSVAQTLAPAVGPSFDPTPAHGCQPTYQPPRCGNIPRGWHPDQPHWGDLIVTVTVDGRCKVQVERVEAGSYRKGLCTNSRRLSLDAYLISSRLE